MKAIEARTEAGARLVALGEALARELEPLAARDDASGDYGAEQLARVVESGFAYGAVPAECGGMGVESVHDLALAGSRLARGDAATAIGINMHAIAMAALAQQWRRSLAAGQPSRAARLAAGLESIVQRRDIVAALISEPDQDLTAPKTTARIEGESAVINGRKVFCTMTPGATIVNVAVTYQGPASAPRYGFVSIPHPHPGLVEHGDWDALGMRASGSGSVSFEDCRVPAASIRDLGPAGEYSAAFVERYLNSGLFHAAASLGIAERAFQLVRDDFDRRPGKRLQPGAQSLLAECAMRLTGAQGAFHRAGEILDGYYAAADAHREQSSDPYETFAAVQAAKTIVCGEAQETVDVALTLSGGAGFMSKHPLSRLYRDVRAGRFMHPVAEHAAHELIGRLLLGLSPKDGSTLLQTNGEIRAA